jgi:hypothetical protein
MRPASLSPHTRFARDSLHQRVVLHRLVEIDRRARWRVKAGEPHGAEEHQPERIVRVFELRPHILVVHAPAVGRDVEALGGHIRLFILAGAHDHGHVRRLHPGDLGLQRGPFFA